MALTYHVRKLIKERIKENLKTIDIFNDDNILFDDPENLEEDAKTPVVFINSISENLEVATIGGIGQKNGRVFQRTFTISIIAFIKSNNYLNDKLDALNYDIETAMSSTKEKATLNNLVKYINLTNVDFQYFDDYEKKVGCLKLDYDIIYFTNEYNVSTSN